MTRAAAALKLILATDSRLRLRGIRLRPDRELVKEQREVAPGVMGVWGTLYPSTSSTMRKARPRASGSTIWAESKHEVSVKLIMLSVTLWQQFHHPSEVISRNTLIFTNNPQVYLWYPMLGRRYIERWWCLCTGQRDVVLAGKFHLPDHLRLQFTVAQTTVAKALSLPFLCGVAILANPKPVCCAPGSKETFPSGSSHWPEEGQRCIHGHKCFLFPLCSCDLVLLFSLTHCYSKWMSRRSVRERKWSPWWCSFERKCGKFSELMKAYSKKKNTVHKINRWCDGGKKRTCPDMPPDTLPF